MISIANWFVEHIAEQHPSYLNVWYEASAINALEKLRRLYQISLFQQYLRANAMGCDLHVFLAGYDQEELFDGIDEILVDKLSREWKIDANLTRAVLLQIIKYDLRSVDHPR